MNSREMRGKPIVFCNFDDSAERLFKTFKLMLPRKLASSWFKAKESRDGNKDAEQVAEESEAEPDESVLLCKSCKRTIEKKINAMFKANASASAASDTKRRKRKSGRGEGRKAESVEDYVSDKNNSIK